MCKNLISGQSVDDYCENVQEFLIPGKSAEGPVDSVGEELGKLSGFKYFNFKSIKKGMNSKLDISHLTAGRSGKIQGIGEPAAEGEEGAGAFNQLSCRH